MVRVILCSIDNSCGENVSTLTHRQPNNKLIATVNILKNKLSSADCHLQNWKSCLNTSPVEALQPLFPLKKAASAQAFPAVIQAEKYNVEEEGEEGIGKRFQSGNMLNKHSCLVLLPCSEKRVSEGNGLMVNVIHSAIRVFAVYMKSVESQPCDLCSCQSALHAKPTKILSTGSSSQQPALGTKMFNEQPQV